MSHCQVHTFIYVIYRASGIDSVRHLKEFIERKKRDQWRLTASMHRVGKYFAFI